MKEAEAKREGGFFPMAIISMKALLESGVHFGHRTNKWDPRMKPYIFTERNGIHIIDLQQTVKLLNQAYNLIRDTVSEGGTILFVGTKRQAQETIAEEATRCGMPYVTERWLGGTLTNWSTIHQRIQELENLEKMRDSGEINRLTKKEGLMIEREINRLEKRLSGVRNMKRIPELLFIVDVMREDSAVHEANLLDIPIIALVDTNCNPHNVDYVIPSNDDAIRAIKLLVGKIADAVLEGKAVRKDEAEEEELKPEAAPAPTARRTTKPASIDEEELEEEDLLGEATLAKLSNSRKGAEEEDEEEDEEKKDKKSSERKKAAKTEDTVEDAAEETDESVEEEAQADETEEAVEEETQAEEVEETVEEETQTDETKKEE
jgi:small subunit ribosomal protein S2